MTTVNLPAWAQVSDKRRTHIERVTALLDRWASELHLSPDEARDWHDVGAWHDALRDAGEAELRQWAGDAPWPLTVLHGPAAANRLAAEGETRSGVLDAIRWHTERLAIEETARAAECTIEEARRVLAMSRYPISLDRPVGNSEDSHFGDLLPDSGAESPAIGAAHEMLRGQISKVLKTLSYREREIIKLRYGLGDGYSYTLEEVGHIFKVTRERIRQIEAKAVRKLQQPSRSGELIGFLD